MKASKKPAFYAMTLNELASWVNANNNGMFDWLPPTDELDDEEEKESRDEYEAMADEIWEAK